MSTAVTTVDSGISTCMLVDCLSTNTTIPTIIDKKCLTDFREKMIHSLETNSIETGLQGLTVEPTCALPAERSLSPSLESNAIQEGTDVTTLEALTSDDTISSTYRQANVMQLAEPTCAPPAERSLSPSLKNSAIQERSQRGAQEPDQTTSEALSSDDTISSTHQ